MKYLHGAGFVNYNSAKDFDADLHLAGTGLTQPEPGDILKK